MTHGSNLDGFRCVLFDWGGTLMVDDALMKGSMAYWPSVEALPGAAETLSRIKPGRLLALATGAEFSSEAEIRLALARVDLNGWIDAIFCFKNTGLQKPEVAFYRHILDRLGVDPEETLMVGDSFEKDIAAANRAGMRAVWFNPLSNEERNNPMVQTIHHLLELPVLLERGW
ncbi:MAG: HAD family hydrolase [Anaerolineaceae bacterium]